MKAELYPLIVSLGTIWNWTIKYKTRQLNTLNERLVGHTACQNLWISLNLKYYLTQKLNSKYFTKWHVLFNFCFAVKAISSFFLSLSLKTLVKTLSRQLQFYEGQFPFLVMICWKLSNLWNLKHDRCYRQDQSSV